MPAQSQESKRAGMEAFLDIYEEFGDVMERKESYYSNLLTSEKIALFAIYVGRME